MPELDPVRARLVADISDMISSLQEGKKALEDLGEGGKKASSDLSDALSEAGEKAIEMAGEFLAVSEAVNLVSESLTALGQKQDVINGLNLALAAQGNYSRDTSDELQKYAESLSNVTTFSQNAIMGTEKYFSVLGMSKEQTEQATKATADLAAFTGRDLADAQMQVGKAIETGSARALGNLGIHIDKTADASTRLQQVMDGIESKMGGSAAAAATTYTGQLKQLGNATEEAKTSFGFFLTQLVTPPSGAMTGWMRDVEKYFRTDLVLALNEARVKMLEGMATLADWGTAAELKMAQAQFAITGNISAFKGLVFDKQGQAHSDYAASLMYQAGKLREEGDAAVNAGIQGTVTPTNNANPSGFHAADEAARAAAAAKVVESATKAVDAEMQRMDASGGKAYSEIAKGATYAAAMHDGLGSTYAAYAAKQDEVDSKTDAALTTLKDGYDKAMETADKAGVSTDALTAEYLTNQQAIIDAGNAQHALNDAQRDASLGTITQSEAVKTLLEDHPALSASLKKVAEDEKIAAQQAIAMRQGIVDIAGAASGLASTLGAGGLSSAFDAVGKGMSDFSKMADSQNPLQLAAATIGFVSDIAKGIKSLFGGPTEQQKIGTDIGGNITQALEDSIVSTETKEKVGRALAEELNVSGILKETGSTGETSKLINDLLNGVKLRAVDAKEGIQSLTDAFTELQTEAAGGSTASEAAMIQMIQRSRELGETIPAIDTYVNGLMTDAATQLQAMFSGQLAGSVSAAQSAANNQLFDAAWQGAISKLGVVGAMKQFGPDVTALQKLGGPLSGGAADAAQMQSLLKDTGFSGAATGSEAAGQYTHDLLDSGNLSQKTLDALETTGRTYYNQALMGATQQLDTAHAQRAAEEATLPLLTQLAHAQAMGLKLSPDMQDMLTQAQTDGLLPVMDTATQQLTAQLQIRDGVYKLAGIAVPASPGPGGAPIQPGGVPGQPGGIPPHPTGPPAGTPTGPGGTHAADGFFSASMPIGPFAGGGSPLVVHPGERVSVTPANRNSGGGGIDHDVMIRMHTEVTTKLATMPAMFASAIRDALQQAGLTR